MREDCPRCGAERSTAGSCPECGYAPPHPGVLGAYRRALGRLAERPSLALPYLAPAIVLAAVQSLLLVTGERSTGLGGPAEAAAALGALFLEVAWYLAALGASVRAATSDAALELPSGGVVRAAIAGAGLVTLPWVLVAAILVVQPTGALGAIGLLASVLLLIAAVFLAGRAVGLPVEAALHQLPGLAVVTQGSRRARDNGGLGLVFLAMLLLATIPFVPGLLDGLDLLEVGPWTLLSAGSLISWLLGAWIGTAIAIGLVGRSEGPETTFDCPACGRRVEVEGGRAACKCGLEGPFYEGSRAPEVG